MTVGSAKIDLHIPASGSLKDKRRVVKSLKDRLLARFAVAVAEVDRLDEWQRAVLGVACVSNDARLVDAMLTKIVTWIEGSGEVLVLDVDIEVVTR